MKYYSIGEVCAILDVKPHVLRYWEQAIPSLAPRKNHFGNRTYTRRDINSFIRVKHLLYSRKYTVEGAAARILEEMSGSQGDQIARIGEMRESLLRILDTLDTRNRQTAATDGNNDSGKSAGGNNDGL